MNRLSQIIKELNSLGFKKEANRLQSAADLSDYALDPLPPFRPRPSKDLKYVDQDYSFKSWRDENQDPDYRRSRAKYWHPALKRIQNHLGEALQIVYDELPTAIRDDMQSRIEEAMDGVSKWGEKDN